MKVLVIGAQGQLARALTECVPWRRGQIVSYDELFDVVKSGRNRDNVRKHVGTIRDAFREMDPAFDRIENVPMRGFRWTDPSASR